MSQPPSMFCCSQVVRHGPGALECLDEEIRKLGASRPALVTDPGLVRAGGTERVRAASSLPLAVFDQVEPEPPYSVVEQCSGFLKEQQCDLVIGLGGGSSLDVAKMAAAMVANAGSVADYWGVGRLPKRGLPVIAIPTTAGTGSEVSPAAVFKDPIDKAKKGVRSDLLLPRVAILDPLLTLGLPPMLTASTGMDALIHAIEAYTSPKATLTSDGMAEQAMKLIGANLRLAYSQGDSLAARNAMLIGSFFAGLALAEVNVGAVHALAQALGGRYPVAHGVANALFLPYVMAFNRPACEGKYAAVAALLGEPVQGLGLADASARAVQAAQRLVQDLRLPRTLRELNVPEQALDEIAQACMATQGRNLTNNARPVTLEDARTLLQSAY
jgi:alcohol dehydrogenase class IV